MKQPCSLLPLLFLFFFQTISAQVHFNLRQLPDNTWAIHTIICDGVIPSDNVITGSSQVTVVGPTGFTITDLESYNGLWLFNSYVDAPLEAPNKAYASAALVNSGTAVVPFTPGEETLLMTFNTSEPLGGQLFLIDNETDPFLPPNSWSANVGNEYTALDIGLNPYAEYDYSGNYGEGAANCGLSDITVIKGTARFDIDSNCEYDNGDPSLANWKVRLERSGHSWTTFTDDEGNFTLYGDSSQDYTLTLAPLSAIWDICENSFTLDLSGTDTLAVDFTATAPEKCTQMSVEINVPNLRRCFNDNVFTVNWRNTGTAAATGVYVDVQFDQYIDVYYSAMPYDSLSDNIYRFEIGDVEIGQSGSFKVLANVSCEADLGSTLCSIARIFPDEFCPLIIGDWNGASVFVDGVCTGNEVVFNIINNGDGDMETASNYRIIRNLEEIESGTFQLPAGEQQSFSFPTNGATYRVEVDQVTDYPVPTSPSESIEACGVNADDADLGLINVFPTADYGDTYDEVCRTVTGSFDPNDKQGFPVGYGNEHFIKRNTDIEYLIRFQNTGTDTAFTVVILDTLTNLLDVSSILPGPSSHPYRLSILDDEALEFSFENIMLPDSNVNEPASHGFVSFTISQKPDLPINAVINNTAAIYFDFNAPIFTNETFHSIGENFVETTAAKKVLLSNLELNVFPNPLSEGAYFEMENVEFKTGELQVFDLTGQLMDNIYFKEKRFYFQKNNLSAGCYFYKINLDGKIAATGKLFVF